MSNPRYYWYGFVKNKVVGRYNQLDSNNEIERKFVSAVDDTLKEIETEENGEAKLKAIHAICLSQTHTTHGAAEMLNYSDDTVYRWVGAFVKNVGIKAGFPDRK